MSTIVKEKEKRMKRSKVEEEEKEKKDSRRLNLVLSALMKLVWDLLLIISYLNIVLLVTLF